MALWEELALHDGRMATLFLLINFYKLKMNFPESPSLMEVPPSTYLKGMGVQGYHVDP